MFFPREFPEPEELAELLAELDLSEAVDFRRSPWRCAGLKS